MSKKQLIVASVINMLFLSGCATMVDYKKIGIKATEESRAGYIKDHPELPKIIKEDISLGIIREGMNTEQVIASWGEPDLKGETDEVITFIYNVASDTYMYPYNNIGVFLYFRKRSILKGTPEYLFSWYPSDIKKVYKEIKEEETPTLTIKGEIN